MSERGLVDITGRPRSPAATPRHRAGRAPPNKGLRYPADPPTVEEIILVMRAAGQSPYADRTRGLIAILWRAGLRISQALTLTESDLDPKTGSVLVRDEKGGKRPMVGMDDWGWEHVSRWTEHRVKLPIGRCSASWLARPAVAAGKRQPRGVSFADSPPGPGCTGGSRPTSCGTRTRSRWPTKGSHCRSSKGNSATPISG